jgi:ribosomal protein S18 acetylase RimI-like enzyme
VEAARPARDGDLPRLEEMAREAIAELVPTKGGVMWAAREARPEPVTDSLAAALTDADHFVVVGTIDDTVLGYGVVRSEPLRDGTLLGVVEDLWVEAGGRGVGLGEAMMNELVRWCEERGCRGVDALALPGNRATKNFFETFGLVARAIVVHRPLGTFAADADAAKLAASEALGGAT